MKNELLTIKEKIKILETERSKLDLEISRLKWQYGELDRLDQRERGIKKFLRLKEDWNGQVEYRDHSVPIFFKAGTLIESITGSVYIDDNGDGIIDFPKHLLEEVEVKEYEDSQVIWQG